MNFGANLTIHDLTLDPARLENLMRGLCDELETAGRRLCAVLTAASCHSVVEERDYVDSDYRAGHLRFYYLHHLETPRRCTRLHFFSGPITPTSLFELSTEEKASYLGFTVIRPLPAHPSGTTVIHSRAISNFLGNLLVNERRVVTCTASYSVSLAGNNISFRGTPWMQQDKLVSACASISLWIANWHLSHKFPKDFREYSTSYITDLAFKYSAFTGRAMPSEGLSVEQMLMALTSMGYHPLLRGNSTTAASIQTIYHYLASSIPVVLILNLPRRNDPAKILTGHAITLIGYSLDVTRLADMEVDPDISLAVCGSRYVARFIAQDDSGGPYRFCEFLTWDQAIKEGVVTLETADALRQSLHCVVRFDNNEIAYLQEVLIPLHLRVTLPDSTAHYNAIEVVSRNVKHIALSDLVFDTFLMVASDYKEWWAPSLGRPTDVSNEFRQQPFPRWIWVTEYGTSSAMRTNSDQRILGHIIQDCSGRGTGKVQDDLLAFFSPEKIAVVQIDGRFDVANRSTPNLGLPSILDSSTQ